MPKKEVQGTHIDIPDSYSSIKFRQRYDIYAPYILSIINVNNTETTAVLIDNFIQFKSRNNIQLKLLLIGTIETKRFNHPDIILLDLSEESLRFGAIEGCEFMIYSSLTDNSFINILEAWSLNKPVLINGKNTTLLALCDDAKGGLSYVNFIDFEKSTLKLLSEGYHYNYLSDY